MPPAAAIAEPADADLLARARRCASLGEDEAAKQFCLAALRLDPTSLEGLLELGRLAMRSGHRSAAITCWRQAALCHPADPAGHVNLGGALVEQDDFDGAREAFAAALAARPGLAAAHQGMARALTGLGDTQGADAHWRLGLADGWLAPQPYRGAGPPVPMLLLVSARGGNIPTRALVDDTVFAVTVAYAEGHDPTRPLPGHALIFNAIGDADLCAEALAKAADLVRRSGRPVVNAPSAVALTTRAGVARRLAGIPGLVVAEIRSFRRAALLEAKLGFPLLVRALGFHTGRHFVRVERPAELGAAVAGLPGDELLAIRPLDARGPDGRFRKYRVMAIGGALYPLHLAVSPDWKVHYFSASMAECAAARAEEAAFLADMAGVLGRRAMAALAAVAERLGLDYGGVDFGLSPDGEVLLFEANAGMVIQPPGPEPIWDYRRGPIAQALAASEALLLARASPSVPRPR